jgi:hypothetical protein
MVVEQTRWSAHGWTPDPPGRLGADVQLVLVFGSRATLQAGGVLEHVRRAYPNAQVTGCSTSGEIHDVRVFDDSAVVTAISFRKTPLRVASVRLEEVSSNEEAGALLGDRLAAPDLRHVFVLSDGLHVNGSELVRGLTSRLPESVTVTGGLAGDGSAFEQTVVIVNGAPHDRVVVAIGLYGDAVRVGYGSLGGWDPFGPERIVTRAKGNVLYELDGQSALGLYRKYLGDHEKDLPASGLLFPLSVRMDLDSLGVVRTILSVSDADDSMTFAGDIAEGSYARLMRANFDRLIEGASGAARISADAAHGGPGQQSELALLISCVGRKMVLKQRIEEEVESVREVVGPSAVLAGFYSYGEIAPFMKNAKCELHNQTMTITTLAEE